jgi:hypothetical protein
MSEEKRKSISLEMPASAQAASDELGRFAVLGVQARRRMHGVAIDNPRIFVPRELPAVTTTDALREALESEVFDGHFNSKPDRRMIYEDLAAGD